MRFLSRRATRTGTLEAGRPRAIRCGGSIGSERDSSFTGELAAGTGAILIPPRSGGVGVRNGAGVGLSPSGCGRDSEKRLQPRLRPPEDQRVNVVGALVGVHGLEVLRHAHDVVLLLDAVAAVHVAGLAGDVERLAAVVALDQRDRLGRELALVEEAPGPERGVQAERDLGLHVGELLLHELRLRERAAELLALERVLPRRVPAELGRAHGAPGDAVAGPVEAAERAFQPRGVRQKRLFPDLDPVHDDFAGYRGAERQLAADLRRREALHALLEHEAANLVVVRRRLRPDDEDVGDGRVRDPRLGAGEAIAARRLLGPGLHAAGVGAGVGLGQAEAADPLARGEPRQVLLALRLVAIGIDRV